MSGSRVFRVALVVDTQPLLPPPRARRRSSRMGGPSRVGLRRVCRGV